MNKVKMFDSSAPALLGVALSMIIFTSGCAVGTQGQSGEGQSDSDVENSEVKEPLDASRVSFCELLKAENVQALGLDPKGEIEPNELDPSLPDSCVWDSSDGKKSASLTVISGRSIQEYRDNSASYVDFAEMNIAGHPAVQANTASPEEGSCGIFLATKDDQVLASILIDAAGADEPSDPCSLSKKALELSVPQLPSVK